MTNLVSLKKILLLIILALSFTLFGQEASEFKLFKSNTYVKNPLDLRDPFKRRINKKKSNSKKSQAQLGNYSNYNQSLEGKPIESIQVIGVVIGAERRAMIRISGEEGNIIYLKEGMKLGENGAEVKAILPGGVVLVEKIRNVYDQDEYLETIIPVSE